jgi:hypothetical protein
MRRRDLLAGIGAALAGGRAVARPAWRGAPSLEGTWDLGNYTELERPAGLARLVLTPAEAEAFEAPRRAMHGMLGGKPGEVGQAENEWTDRGSGLARVNGEIRASTIVDPPDGLLPYNARGEALAGPRGGPAMSAAGGLDNPETMGGTTRCLASFEAGAPTLGGPDANCIQVVQTRQAVAILSEKYHDVRIIRLFPDARAGEAALAAARGDPPSWLGNSVGWWEAGALEVRTAGFRPEPVDRGQRLLVSGQTRVAERLARLPSGEILYRFTVEDPSLLTRPWRGETVIHPTKGRVFEYACHEGNYAMAGMLAGARREERDAAGK